jgi:WD40 repeat protein/tRNA A-37 threonylcarbamoyl transferase component Bud32
MTDPLRTAADPPAPAPDADATLQPGGKTDTAPADPFQTIAQADGAPAPAGGGRLPPGYILIGELGRGGMGVVYKARHQALGRIVALKMILSGGHAGPEDVARFLAEAEAVARLQHPNIVQIFESGRHQEMPFFTLEFVPGGTLADKIRVAPLPPREAARIVQQLALGVAYAHDQGVIHRDLKPENVLLAEDGTPKITDFGLAKRVESPGMTQSGAILGTPAYMAPEQAAGRTRAIGPHTDVYALGAILYRLLTGRPPFQAASIMDTLWQVVEAEPAAPSQLQAKLPRDLETIVLKCLQKDPARRYASARELAEDLRRFQAGEPIQARRVGTAERFWRWCRRNPGVAASLAAVALSLLAGTVVAWVLALQAEANARAADAERERAEKASDEAQASARKAHHEKLVADKAKAHAEQQRTLASEERTKAVDALKQVRQSLVTAQLLRVAVLYRTDHVSAMALLHDREAIPLGLRDAAWHFYANRCRRRVLDLHGGGAVTAVAYGGAGDLLAVGSRDKAVTLWDAAAGKERATLPARAAVTSVAFSADGTLLAWGCTDGTITLWDVKAGKERGTLEGHQGAVLTVAVSSDGKVIASGGDDKLVRLWSVEQGKATGALPGHTGAVNAVAFTPDGKLLASASNDATVKLWSADLHEELATLRGHKREVKAVAFSKDGSILASGSTDTTVKLWNVATRQERAAFKAHEVGITAVALSADGKTLATAAGNGVLKLWDVAFGVERAALTGHKALATSLAFSHDGRTLASGSTDKTVKLWAVGETQEWRTFKRQGPAGTWLAFSKDSGLLAARSGNAVQLWEPATGREAGMLEGHTAPVLAAAFDPDGKILHTAAGDGTMQAWDVANHSTLTRATWTVESGAVLALSPDGATLAAAGQTGVIRLIDTRNSEVRKTLPNCPAGVAVLAFAPDGKTLAAAGKDKVIRLWDVATGDERATWQGPGGIRCLAWNHDSTLVACGGDDKNVELWDAATGMVRATLKGHTKTVRALAFSRDDKSLASAAEDMSLRLWGVAAAQERADLKAIGAPFLAGSVTALAFSADGHWLASDGPDGVKLWDVGRE